MSNDATVRGRVARVSSLVPQARAAEAPHPPNPPSADGLSSSRPSRLLYRVEEAAFLLSIGRTRVFELLRSGQLRSVTYGRTRLISHGALVEFVRQLEEPA